MEQLRVSPQLGREAEHSSDYDPVDFIFQTGYNETNAVTVSTGNEKEPDIPPLAAN